MSDFIRNGIDQRKLEKIEKEADRYFRSNGVNYREFLALKISKLVQVLIFRSTEDIKHFNQIFMNDISIIIDELRKPAYDQQTIGKAIAGLSAKIMEIAEVQEVFKGDLTDPRIQTFIIDFSGIFAKFNNFATNAEGLKEFLTSTSTYESFHAALNEGFAELKRIQNSDPWISNRQFSY